MTVTEPAHAEAAARPVERDVHRDVHRDVDRDVESTVAHLLRLCLDLQLDAMLLTLGALAADPGPDGAAPWRRWVTEDVDLACKLAGEALAGKAALPPTLGSDLGHAMPVTAIDDLVARYTSMIGLLDDARRVEGGFRPAGLADAIARCEARLDELHRYRLVNTPATGLDLRVEHQFLPGELLG
jgi:hypothetical protein